MPLRAVAAGLLALALAACAPSHSQTSGPSPAAADVELIEGQESAGYERLAQISLLMFGADAKEGVVDRARSRAAELGADALSFQLYAVTRPPAAVKTARRRRSHAAYSPAPLLHARVSCAVIERAGDPEASVAEDDPGSVPGCSDLDESFRAYTPVRLGRKAAVAVEDRGYILVGWVLRRRPETVRGTSS